MVQRVLWGLSSRRCTGCVMDELLRLAFVSTGTFAILAYLAYVAWTEGTFKR